MAPGRKPFSDLPKTDTLRIRLTDLERSELDAAAESLGQGTSTWARDVLLQVARDRRKAAAKSGAKRKPR